MHKHIAQVLGFLHHVKKDPKSEPKDDSPWSAKRKTGHKGKGGGERIFATLPDPHKEGGSLRVPLSRRVRRMLARIPQDDRDCVFGWVQSFGGSFHALSKAGNVALVSERSMFPELRRRVCVLRRAEIILKKKRAMS